MPPFLLVETFVVVGKNDIDRVSLLPTDVLGGCEYARLSNKQLVRLCRQPASFCSRTGLHQWKLFPFEPNCAVSGRCKQSQGRCPCQGWRKHLLSFSACLFLVKWQYVYVGTKFLTQSLAHFESHPVFWGSEPSPSAG